MPKKKKYFEECHCCGNVVVAHPYKLSKGLVKAYCTFFTEYMLRKRKHHNNEIWLEPKEIKFTTDSQYTNFARLKHWGIMTDKGSGKGRKPTKKGEDWFFGRITIPDTLIVMANVSLPVEHPAWEIAERQQKMCSLSDIIENSEYERYKQVADYQKEMPTLLDRGRGLFTPEQIEQCDQ